jgi:hypothetical protein
MPKEPLIRHIVPSGQDRQTLKVDRVYGCGRLGLGLASGHSPGVKKLISQNLASLAWCSPQVASNW